MATIWNISILHEEHSLYSHGSIKFSCISEFAHKNPFPLTTSERSHLGYIILILTREFGLHAVDKVASRTVSNVVWNINRGPTH